MHFGVVPYQNNSINKGMLTYPSTHSGKLKMLKILSRVDFILSEVFNFMFKMFVGNSERAFKNYLTRSGEIDPIYAAW